MRSSRLWMRSSRLGMRSSRLWMRSNRLWMRSSRLGMRSSRLRMRSSRVIRVSDGQCRSRNCPGFDPSILWHSEIWEAADEAVLNKLLKKNPKIPLFKYNSQWKIWNIFTSRLRSYLLKEYAARTFQAPSPSMLLYCMWHRVGRVLSFSPDLRNWDSPNPSPAGENPPPTFGSGGRGTLAGERGGGRVPILTRGHTLWYSVNTFTLWHGVCRHLCRFPVWINSHIECLCNILQFSKTSPHTTLMYLISFVFFKEPYNSKWSHGFVLY